MPLPVAFSVPVNRDLDTLRLALALAVRLALGCSDTVGDNSDGSDSEGDVDGVSVAEKD